VGCCLTSKFDFHPWQCDICRVKAAKAIIERKTRGTIAVEKHWPAMNKLTSATRRRLRQRAAELLYGHETGALFPVLDLEQDTPELAALMRQSRSGRNVLHRKGDIRKVLAKVQSGLGQ